MLLTDILERNMREHPDRPALTMRMGYRTVSLRYRDVYDLSVRIACLLEKERVQKGDAVLLFASNSPYWVCVFWGALLRGAVVVPLNTQSTEATVRRIAEQTGARIIFVDGQGVRNTPSDLRRIDMDVLRETVADLDCSGYRKDDAQPHDIAEIMYTSGTTGEPKGVMLTHANIFSNVEALSRIIPRFRRDKFLSILPLSHIFEQVIGFLLPFSHATEIVYSHSPAAVRGLLKEHRITTMAAVPEFLRVVMAKIEARAEERGKLKFFSGMMDVSRRIGIRPLQRLLFSRVHAAFGGKLRTVACGGAPLDPALEKKWEALGIALLQGYGITETSPVVTTNTYAQRRLGSVGKPIPEVEVKIAQDGEILVRGPNVFQGYFKNVEKTKDAFTDDGWFRTEDIGEIDGGGFLYIKGRKKYMILGPGGQNVYPEDIEFELNGISGVKDSCVLGIETPGGQVEIHAVLLLAQPSEAERVVNETNAGLASYQQITGWSVWKEDDFPRSATRKVQKEKVLASIKDGRKKEDGTEPGRESTPLMRILARISGTDVSQIDASTKFIPRLYFDSLLRVELVAQIEDDLGVMIDEAKITPSTTVAELEAMTTAAPPAMRKPGLKTWPTSRLTASARTLLQTLLIFPLARIFVKLKVEGEEHLEGLPLPAVFMPNHLSYLDSLVIVMALPRRIRRRLAFAAAQDVVYETYASIAWLLELTFNCFPFPRRENQRITSGLERMGRMLDRGFSVVVFPEGKMSRSGELQQLKRGAGLVAGEMDSYIVPVKHEGTNIILPYAKILPRKRGTVTVTFSKPLKFSTHGSYVDATAVIQKELQRL